MIISRLAFGIKVANRVTKPAIPFLEAQHFIKESAYLLSTLDEAFSKAKLSDDRVSIKVSTRHELLVEVKDYGAYDFKSSVEQRLLFFACPTEAGQYFYDPVTQYWRSARDDHLLIEFLSRETSRHLKGYLEL